MLFIEIQSAKAYPDSFELEVEAKIASFLGGTTYPAGTAKSVIKASTMANIHIAIFCTFLCVT
jgi:hypothetical protein